MPVVSLRAQNIPASPIRRLTPLADATASRGVHVHRLNIGQPDVHTPRAMIEAYQTYDEPVLAYGPSLGIPALREAAAADYARHGSAVDASDVIVTTGGSEAIRFSLCAVADPGDEVLVFEPFYANYLGFAAEYGVHLRAVSSSIDSGFHLPDIETIEAAITERTKAILVTSPGNPTGAIYSSEEMSRLGEVALRHDLFLISDEAYREFAYDGVKVTSALTLDQVLDRVIVVDSVSKRYSACGARIGFFVSKNPEVHQAAMRMAFARLCPATVDQRAALAAFATPQTYFDEVVAEYTRRRDVLVDGLRQIEGVQTYTPEGAFYTMATFPVDDVDRFAAWLLTDFSLDGETVMLAPASGFYSTPGLGTKEARIAYVLECEALRRAALCLAAAIPRYLESGRGALPRA
ncbi:MAG: pyridoxal phosphate-dependent aminotransferase [Deltaproteobacteria bacterium]|nr:pyridoxal phosphate-dependent aminotransferase [Deltaproteobacteria bacterium]